MGKLRKYTLENTEGAIQMDNPEKLATLDTQDEEKQNKYTAQYAYIDKRLYHLEAPIITIHICSFVGEVFMAGIAILIDNCFTPILPTVMLQVFHGQVSYVVGFIPTYAIST